MSKIIKFYRHGETEWNKEGRLQGWLDSPLTVKGKSDASRVKWDPDIVFCSDLPRARLTAQLMFPNVNLRESTALREIYLGEWQGKNIKDLQRDEDYLCYLNTPERFQAATQESFSQVTMRMQQFYEELEQLPYEKIAVVSHGVAIACLTVELSNKSLVELWSAMLTGCESISFSI